MIRPVEIADTLSKTELIAKLYQMKNASSEMEQREAATVVEKKTTADAERTKEPEKSDLIIISKDKKEEEEKRRQPKKERMTGNENQDEAGDNSPDHLDVKA